MLFEPDRRGNETTMRRQAMGIRQRAFACRTAFGHLPKCCIGRGNELARHLHGAVAGHDHRSQPLQGQRADEVGIMD